MAKQRGRLKPRRNLGPLKTADKYLTDAAFTDKLRRTTALSLAAFPIDVTEGIVQWGMCGNDQWGDCFAAAEWHLEMATGDAANKVAAQGAQPLPGPTLSATAPNALYRARAYWGPSVTGPPGPGASLATFLTWCVRQKYLVAFAPLDRTNRQTMAWFMSQGYGIYVGVNLNSQAEQQFDAGQPWDVGPTDQPTPTDGHCVLWSYSATLVGPHKFVSWGKLQEATEAWVKACLVTNPDGEAYLLVTTEDQLAPFGPGLLADVQSLCAKQAEYEVCQRRGHDAASPTTAGTDYLRTSLFKTGATGVIPADPVCKWCGTKFHYKQVVVEDR